MVLSGGKYFTAAVRRPQREEKGPSGLTAVKQRVGDRTGCLFYRLQRAGRSVLLVKFNSGPGYLCTTTVRQAAFRRVLNGCQNLIWEKLNLCARVCAAAVLMN